MKQSIAVPGLCIASLLFASACVVDDGDLEVASQELGDEAKEDEPIEGGGGESLAPLPRLDVTSFNLAFGTETTGSYASTFDLDGVNHGLREKLIGPGCIGPGCHDLRAEWRFDGLSSAAGSYSFEFVARIVSGAEYFRFTILRQNGVAVPWEGSGGCVIYSSQYLGCRAYFNKFAGDTSLSLKVDDMNVGNGAGIVEVDYIGLVPGHVPVDILAPRSVWSGWTSNQASLTYNDPYAQHAWSITGGYINGNPNGASVLFGAGAPGSVMELTVDRTYPQGTDTARRKVFVDFLDVPPDFTAHDDVVTLGGLGITGGCGGGNYCPTWSLTREQMAVMVLVAKEGTGYAPPAATGTMFLDVPASSGYARWIEELARRGVVGGCGGGYFCPTSSVTRGEIAVFVLKTAGGPNYVPPMAQGIFQDLQGNGFERWAEELYRRGGVMACGDNPLRYCPDTAISRIRLATAVVRGFGLTFP